MARKSVSQAAYEAEIRGQVSAAMASHRDRIIEILQSPEGLRSPYLAQELALKSDIDPVAARAVLKASPGESPYLRALDALGPSGIPANGIPLSGAPGAAADPFQAEDPRAARLAEIQALGAAMRARYK